MDDNRSTAFESSIKVRGVHLLPPVIGEKRRIELQRYKQQAVKLEKRLQNCKELKKNLEDLLKLQPLSARPQSAITFGDNSHIEALGINTSRSTSRSQRKISLSKDIVDVTEYSGDGIKIIKSDIEMNYSELNQGRSDTSNEIIETDMTLDEPTDTRLTPPTSNKDNNQCPLLDLTDLPNSPCSGSTYRNMSPISSPKPRLIRSNSYTLEAPSPMLLAHLEKCNKLECQGTDERSEVNCRNVSSFENTYVPFENSEFNSLNTVYNVNTSKADDPEEVVEILSPRIEVIQTDISVQQITVNGNKDSATENDFDFSDHDCQLIRVLRKIPENYSKQIIELIEKQRKEKLSKAESLRKIEKQFLDEFSKKDLSLQENVERNESNTSDRIKTPYDSSGRPKTGERSYSTTTLSPSQSLSYSVSSSNDTLVADSPSIKLIHFEYEGGKANESERFVTADKSMDDLQSPRVPKDNSNFSRELFPRLCDGLDLESLKQDWAARVIGAHVRGYLTRRLLRTERVQSLIETIKDALLCALQLHNADNIDESDVELHRRLINQVSAACYAFHDIFFSLSLPEQMSVIAVDRHRKIEKAKRPISAPVSGRSRSNSSQSSARSHAKQSQSLTKV